MMCLVGSVNNPLTNSCLKLLIREPFLVFSFIWVKVNIDLCYKLT